MSRVKKYTIYIPGNDPVILYASYYEYVGNKVIFTKSDGWIRTVGVFHTDVIAGFSVEEEE